MIPHLEGFVEFCELRWPPHGKPLCPWCQSGKYYEIPTRMKFKCRACRRQYSPTSGTVFSGRKLRWAELTTAFRLLKDGTTPIELHRVIPIQYRSAWDMHRKFHEQEGFAQVDGNPKGGDAKQAPGDSLTARSRSDAPDTGSDTAGRE